MCSRSDPNRGLEIDKSLPVMRPFPFEVAHLDLNDSRILPGPSGAVNLGFSKVLKELFVESGKSSSGSTSHARDHMGDGAKAPDEADLVRVEAVSLCCVRDRASDQVVGRGQGIGFLHDVAGSMAAKDRSRRPLVSGQGRLAP